MIYYIIIISILIVILCILGYYMYKTRNSVTLIKLDKDNKVILETKKEVKDK